MDKSQRSRLDAHSIQAHLIMATTSAKGEVETHEGFVLGYTGVDLPIYNFFIPLKLTGLTDDTLADASAFFDSRNAQYTICIEEHRVPDGTEYLSNRRYQPLPPQPIMHLSHLPEKPYKKDKFLVREVDTIPNITAFYTIIKSVYDYTQDEVNLIFPSSQLSQTQIKHFIGFVPSKGPTTVGTAIYSHNVVSIWNLSTLDNFRQQGFATTLMNYILVDAKKQGCDLSLIYASPMGFSLLNELGYKLHATRQWFLPQEEQTDE